MARAPKLRCQVRVGSFGFGGMSPIKQCTKPAVVRQNWTVKATGQKMSELHCSAHLDPAAERRIALGYLDSVEQL